MTGERSYPVLPCANIEEALTFYGALGFEVTFKQLRPYPCAVVALDDLQIHLAAIDGFDPANSYASTIITVSNPGELHESFRNGLREQFGKIPVNGIPRILPPRRKAGTATGFSIVDVGGNWLRFYRDGASENDASEEKRTGLGRIIDVAARQGDSRGDDSQAISVLDSGILRYPDAPPFERFEAHLYRAELKARINEDAADDLALAASLIVTYQLGEDAERQLARAQESTPT